MPDAKIELGSFSSFGNMMSQIFPVKKGTSDQIRIPGKCVLSSRNLVFMSRIVLLGPKLTSHVNFSNFQVEENFFLFKIFEDVPMRIEQQQPPLSTNFTRICSKHVLKIKIESHQV